MLRGAVVSWALLSCGLLACTQARAQVSGSVAVVSDHRFRGASLSDGRPALQLALAWERGDGWYAGVFASSARLSAHADLQLLSYVGYARRLHNGSSWEAGAEYTAFRQHSAGNYPELYVGLATERISGRLYYAPRYFSEDDAVAYAELDADKPLDERWRLFGHLGLLRRLRHGEAEAGEGAQRTRIDARVGIGAAFGKFDLQLARVASDGSRGRFSGYPVGAAADTGAWVLSLSRAW